MIAFVGVGFNDCQNETKSFRQRIIFSGNKSSKAFEFRFFNLLFLFQGSNRTHLLDLSQSKTLLGYFFYIKYGEYYRCSSQKVYFKCNNAVLKKIILKLQIWFSLIVSYFYKCSYL